MCEIYEKASCVLVWLGREDASAPAVMDLVKDLSDSATEASDHAIRELIAEPKYVPGAECPFDAYAAKLGRAPHPPHSDKQTNILSVFLRRR